MTTQRLASYARVVAMPAWRIAVLAILIVLTREVIALNRDIHAQRIASAFSDDPMVKVEAGLDQIHNDLEDILTEVYGK